MPTSGLRVRVEPDLREKFIQECRRRDLTASQVIRSFMRQYVEQGPTNYLHNSLGQESSHGQ